VVQAAWSQGLVAAVPGPPTLALFAVGLAAFRFARRRQGA
jgi:hypothetical protein